MNEPLKPGVYRLTRAFPPLLQDKRIKHDWRYAPCAEGSTYIVVVDLNGQHDLIALNDWTHHGFDVRDSAIADFASALVYVETPEIRAYLKMRTHTGSADAVLDVLIANGKITLADVSAALDEIDRVD